MMFGELENPKDFEVEWYHKFIGAIVAITPNGNGKGTGLLISPNLVLTVAHNILIGGRV
jgi:V8-like Glu-specific endopeptidase